MIVSTWSKEATKRFFEISTPILKAFVEKNGEAFHTFAKGIGFIQTSQTRYSFSKPVSPPVAQKTEGGEEAVAEEVSDINPFTGNVEVLDTLHRLLEEEEKKAQ